MLQLVFEGVCNISVNISSNSKSNIQIDSQYFFKVWPFVWNCILRNIKVHLLVTRRIKNAVNLVYFMMSKFIKHRKQKSCTRSEAFHKVFPQREDCSSLQMDYFFSTGNENVFTSQHSICFILTSEFVWISKLWHNPILDS